MKIGMVEEGNYIDGKTPMSTTQEDLDNMKCHEAISYLKTQIYVHEQGIKYCKKMIDRYYGND